MLKKADPWGKLSWTRMGLVFGGGFLGVEWWRWQKSGGRETGSVSSHGWPCVRAQVQVTGTDATRWRRISTGEPVLDGNGRWTARWLS